MKKVIGSLVLIAGLGCSGKPSEEKVEAAIRECLQNKVPAGLISDTSSLASQYGIKDAKGLEVKEICVLEVGEPWRNPPETPNTRCRVRVFVNGFCLDGQGKRIQFQGERTLYLIKNRSGDGWTGIFWE